MKEWWKVGEKKKFETFTLFYGVQKRLNDLEIILKETTDQWSKKWKIFRFVFGSFSQFMFFMLSQHNFIFVSFYEWMKNLVFNALKSDSLKIIGPST